MENIKDHFTAANVVLEIALRITLWSFFLWMEYQVPVIRHIDEDELWNYRYPLQPSIISEANLYIMLIGIPLIIFLIQYLINIKEKYLLPEICVALSGLTLAYCINGLFTASLKLIVGRPRPNFFMTCFPDGYGTNINECTGEYELMMEGRKSFPSGHATFAFTGFIYMMLHLNKSIDLKKPRFGSGFIILAISLLPLTACLISASRAADYHHHYSDIIIGAALGTTIAFVMHHLYEDEDTIRRQAASSFIKNYKDVLKTNH